MACSLFVKLHIFFFLHYLCSVPKAKLSPRSSATVDLYKQLGQASGLNIYYGDILMAGKWKENITNTFLAFKIWFVYNNWSCIGLRAETAAILEIKSCPHDTGLLQWYLTGYVRLCGWWCSQAELFVPLMELWRRYRFLLILDGQKKKCTNTSIIIRWYHINGALGCLWFKPLISLTTG